MDLEWIHQIKQQYWIKVRLYELVNLSSSRNIGTEFDQPFHQSQLVLTDAKQHRRKTILKIP